MPEGEELDTLTHNELGEALEKRNIWYYTEDEEGKQQAGINLFNPQSTPITWVSVGFYPSSCGEMNAPQLAMRLTLSTPLMRKDQTVLVWDMPSEIKLENGCLDILAAG